MAHTRGVLCRLALLGRKPVTRKVAVLPLLCWLVSGMCCCGGGIWLVVAIVCAHAFSCLLIVAIAGQLISTTKLWRFINCFLTLVYSAPCYEIPAFYCCVLLSRLYIEYLLVYYSNICLPIACICVKFLYIILLRLIIFYGTMSWMIMLSLAPFYCCKMYKCHFTRIVSCTIVCIC